MCSGCEKVCDLLGLSPASRLLQQQYAVRLNWIVFSNWTESSMLGFKWREKELGMIFMKLYLSGKHLGDHHATG